MQAVLYITDKLKKSPATVGLFFDLYKSLSW